MPCGVHLIIAWAFQDPRYGLAVHSFLRRDAGLAARPRPKLCFYPITYGNMFNYKLLNDSFLEENYYSRLQII